MSAALARRDNRSQKTALCGCLAAAIAACAADDPRSAVDASIEGADAFAVDGVATTDSADSMADPDPNFCVRSSDCVVVADDCCSADCDNVGRVVLGPRGRRAHMQSCLERGCQGCPISPEWVPFCADNRCAMVELGKSSFSLCQSHTECELRWGSSCCQPCAPDPMRDLVSMSRFVSLCAPGDACEPCDPPPYPEGATSICVSSHCKVLRAALRERIPSP